MKGKVYLIGAGPGDPDLITRKGYKTLLRADCVFTDRLAPDELLQDLDDTVEIVDCGKQPHGHRLSQDEINQKLLNFAESGDRVARLKGGDPMVFGRGGEEYRFLDNRGIEVEVIPGITAATAVSSQLGVPLTDRNVASEVTFLTGHEAPDKEADNLDWECMANCRKTLAIYMGVSRMNEICTTLIEYGRSADTPASVIESVTNNDERIVQGNLSTISEKCKNRSIEPPAILIIGKVLEPRKNSKNTNHTNQQFTRCLYNGEVLL